jgi:DNA-binding NtrC family response regulator
MVAPIQPPAHDPAFTPRQRERRQALGDLLAALIGVFQRESDPALIRGAFEDSLCRILAARTVRLREFGARRYEADREESVESIALDVPGRAGGTAGLLEVSLEPGTAFADWDFQLMTAAAHIAALLVDADRSRAQLARAGIAGRSRTLRDGAAPLIGSAPAILALRSTIERFAGTDFTVLIQGESGVGKELVARQLHELSRRRAGPFVAVNCAAIVETLLEAELFGIEERTATGVRGRRGKFEHADGGTLFLDEVSDLSLSAQAKLLRVIQDLSVERVGGHALRRVDVRIVAATNRSLSEMVDRKLFRADLYYRLSGVDLYVPALRERRSDILELANYFLERHRPSRTMRLSEAAAEALLAYDWPGNVRELERLIERSVTLAESDVITLDDLPSTVCGDYAAVLSPSLARGESLREWAARYARVVLERCGGNKREACRVLKISYHTLQAYLRVQSEHPLPQVAPPAPPEAPADLEIESEEQDAGVLSND